MFVDALNLIPGMVIEQNSSAIEFVLMSFVSLSL